MIDFEAVYCNVDDFCQVFLPAWHRQLLISGELGCGLIGMAMILALRIVWPSSPKTGRGSDALS